MHAINFKLRPWKLSDANSLAKYANNPLIANNLTNQFPHPYTLENADAFIEMARGLSPTQIFAIDINGEAVGGIGLHAQPDVYCKNANVSDVISG